MMNKLPILFLIILVCGCGGTEIPKARVDFEGQAIATADSLLEVVYADSLLEKEFPERRKAIINACLDVRKDMDGLGLVDEYMQEKTHKSINAKVEEYKRMKELIEKNGKRKTF